METVFQHWDKLAGTIGVVISFFAGLKMRKVKLQEASQQALAERYNAELQKLENYKRAFEINAEMLESIKGDFLARIKSLQEYIGQLEQMNEKLNGIIAKQQEKLDAYSSKYGTDL